MSKYQFEGTFRATEWSGLPDRDEIEAAIRKAIGVSARASVFGVTISKIDVTELGGDLPSRIGGGYPEADVVVTWEVHDEAVSALDERETS